MAEQRPTRVWVMRSLYVALCLCIIFMHLLPLAPATTRWAPPDLIMALTFAWAMRRPEYVPAIYVAGIVLLADFLFQRPPGLLAALMVVGSETLRARAHANRDMPYLVEWASVAGVMIGVAVALRLLLAIFFIPAPSLGLVLIQLTMTIALYPLVVLVSHFLFSVRRPAPGEVDALGHRL
ncbi:rod shape-determining protein MreD [Planktotalea sp.]|uniref:rod shape-determining protein MreD n=1 Tax=Planktotalea sp. TaxID=2029877 RepID=UPI003D6B738C